MARINRRDVLADGEIQVVHCINRCVRRAFLCGDDVLTGQNFDHRRELIRNRLEFLAGIMGIEVLGYAVMSNHFHCILRSRPDVVATLSDDEAARKWWMLCPARKNQDGSPAEPSEFELNSIRNDAKGLAEKRVRLASISWFMRFLSERVAKEANRQDECTGRFWEGRFKAQILLDDAAILACMQYVDLNPIRAGIAETPEASDFTSAQDRIGDLKTAMETEVDCSEVGPATHQRLGQSYYNGNSPCAPGPEPATESAAGSNESGPDKVEPSKDVAERGSRAGWLAPIPLALEPQQASVQEEKSDRRASNKGCLSMELADYLSLLDWTARQIHTDKRGSMPQELQPLFERLGISAELWVDCVVNFRKWFRSSVGRPKSMTTAAESHGKNRALSINSARRVFA